MVKRATVMVLLAFGAGCAELDPAVLYRCEAENQCLQAGFTCWSDGFCRPRAEPVDSGSGGGVGGGGGETGGGGGGMTGGGGGGMTGGGGGGGGMTGGGGGTTGGGGGNSCTPCPASSCGYFDAGCGEVYCGGCTGGSECGVARINRCDTPRLCTADGWCFENPLPQGNTIRGAWVAGPREIYFVGDNATALLWNGERHSVIALPAVDEGVDFLSVHGSSPQDIFIVGTRGTLLHFDGTQWTREFIANGFLPDLRSVWVRSGQVAIVVGRNNEIDRRLEDAGWDDDQLTDGPIDLNDVSEGPDGLMYSLGTYRFAQPVAGIMREGDAGLWARFSRPPLTTGNSMWFSADGGLFVAGAFDAGAGQRFGVILKRAADAGWDEIARVPDELRVVRGVSTDELFAAGDNGLFVHVVDGGVRQVRIAGARWNALALQPQGPVVQGHFGQVARYFAGDGGLSLMSGGSTLNVNALCATQSTDLFAASQGTPGCMGGACAPFAFIRTTAGGAPRWNATQPLALPDSSEFVGCASYAGLRWLLGDDTRYLVAPAANFTVENPLAAGLPRTRSTSIWIENGVSGWITNSTQPAPTDLPHVTKMVGTPLGPQFRRVSYDGGGDLVTVMGGVVRRGWALGQRGLAIAVGPDGGFAVPGRLGTEDFVAMDVADLIDGGTLVIATGLNSALYRDEGGAGFVAEPALGADLLATWVGETGDSYVVGADVADGGRRQSRVYRRVGGNWVRVPFAGSQPLRAVWAGPLPDAGHAVWVGAPGGVILRRP